MDEVVKSPADWVWQTAAALPLRASTGPERLPTISVITPSLNQGRFIERTIRSVLRQDYPSLEYIIIDGGSTDDTVQIIKKYEGSLKYWVSEPDRGQSHAINKGLARATGEVLCWLNSDDFYLPDALLSTGAEFAENQNVYALIGDCWKVFKDGRPPVLMEGKFQGRRRMLEFWKGYQMHQPAIFWRREVLEAVGWLDEELHLTMDFDYWARIAERFDFKRLDQALAGCCYHGDAKTGDEYVAYFKELAKHRHRYWGSAFAPQFWSLEASRFRHRSRSWLNRRLKRAT